LTGSAPEAKRYCLRLLAYRGRSELELMERLARKGFDRDVSSAAVEDLKNAGFVDDVKLAANLKRQARETKLLGRSAVRAFLLRRGISRDIAESVLDYDEDAELCSIRKLMSKKMAAAGTMTVADRKRLWNFMVRKGYSTDIIRKVLNDQEFNEEAY